MYDNLNIVVIILEIKRIKNLREDNDLFQKEIADILNITQQQIHAPRLSYNLDAY